MGGLDWHYRPFQATGASQVWGHVLQDTLKIHPDISLNMITGPNNVAHDSRNLHEHCLKKFKTMQLDDKAVDMVRGETDFPARGRNCDNLTLAASKISSCKSKGPRIRSFKTNQSKIAVKELERLGACVNEIDLNDVIEALTAEDNSKMGTSHEREDGSYNSEEIDDVMYKVLGK